MTTIKEKLNRGINPPNMLQSMAIEALRAALAKDDLKTLAQKGCGDCFLQDCVWPTCMSKGTP